MLTQQERERFKAEQERLKAEGKLPDAVVLPEGTAALVGFSSNIEKYSAAGLMERIPVSEWLKLLKVGLDLFLRGKIPFIHLVVDIKERKFSLALYDNATKLIETVLIDLP